VLRADGDLVGARRDDAVADPKLPEVDDDDRRRLGEARGTLAARAGKGKKA
jgi:hypothetical protein